MDIPYTVQPRPDTGLYNAKVGIWLFLASEVMLFGALFSSYILLRVGAAEWPHGLLNIPIGTVNTAVLIASSVTVVLAWASLKLNDFKKFKLFQGLTIVCALIFIIIKSFEYKDKFTHYEVWLEDGSSITGHFEYEGKTPWFWTTGTLEEKGVESLLFHPDAAHGEAEGHEHAEGDEHAEGHEHAAGEGTGHQEEDDHAGAGEDHGTAHAGVEIPVEQISRLSAYIPGHSTYFAIYFVLTGLHALHVLGGALVLGYFWGPGSRMWHTDPERFTNRIEVGGLFWHFVDLVWIFLFPVLYLL